MKLKKGVALILLPLAFFAGCAHARSSVPAAVPLSGVKRELAGTADQALKELSEFYVQQGKVFFYSSKETDSPIVNKADIPLALQFRTVPVNGGFKEASVFNGYMLGYIRSQLRQGLCPEHAGVVLQVKVVRERKSAQGGHAVRTTLASGFIEHKLLVCPVDNRSFTVGAK
jgi:hypothetical protein